MQGAQGEDGTRNIREIIMNNNLTEVTNRT